MAWNPLGLVCSHQLSHAADVWQLQFGWRLLHDKELNSHPHHSHSQAFHLATTAQLCWRHHPTLHEGISSRVAHRFLGVKNDWMQNKTNQFDFLGNHFHEPKFSSVWTFVQIWNKSLRMKMSWMKAVCEEFWKGNKISIKQKWSKWKWAFYHIKCDSFHKCNCFVCGILLLNTLYTVLNKNFFGKFLFHETKWSEQFEICYNCEPLHHRAGKRTEYFVCGILIW